MIDEGFFPRPTGRYQVGTIVYHWIDDARSEIWSDAYRARELTVQCWFPLQEPLSDTPITPYDRAAVLHMQEKLAEKGIPDHERSVLDELRTWAVRYDRLPSAVLQRPVVLCVPGIEVTRANNTIHCENLASHGYLVVAIGHTYATGLTLFPDGRRVGFAVARGEQLLDQLRADVVFVLDRLELLCVRALANVGMFGHSLGGILTMHMLRSEPRIVAGISMDGPPWGQESMVPFSKPFLYLAAQKPWTFFSAHQRRAWGGDDESLENRVARFLAMLKGDCYYRELEGAGHNAFCDYAFLKELAFFKNRRFRLQAGPGNGYDVLRMTNTYIRAFFDCYLTHALSCETLVHILHGEG